MENTTPTKRTTICKHGADQQEYQQQQQPGILAGFLP